MDQVSPKVTNGAVGVAVATVAVFVSQKLGVDFSPEEATAITGALGVIVGAVLGYRASAW